MGNDAVADTGPLIHLSEVSGLTCFQVFKRVFLSLEVRDEVEKHLRKPLGGRRGLFEVKALENPAKREAEILSLRHSLGIGESTALALAKQLKTRVFLTDDLDARVTARQLRLQPVGSVGIVLRAYRRGRVSLEGARKLLTGLERDSSLFITPVLIQKTLAALDAFHKKNA